MRILNKFKKQVSFMLLLVTALTTVMGVTPAYAAENAPVSESVTLIRAGAEKLGVSFKGDEPGATQHRFTYPITVVKDVDGTAGYCITPFARGVSPSGQPQTFTTVPSGSLDEMDKQLLGIMMAGFPVAKYGLSDADAYIATQIAIEHFTFQHTDKYPNPKKVKFNDDNWSHWASDPIINVAKTIYTQGLANPYEPGESTSVEAKATPENDGAFADKGETLELIIAIEASGAFQTAKLTLPDEVKNIVKSGKGSVTVDGKAVSFKSYILGSDDSYEGIPIQAGNKSVKIVLDKASAEAYVSAPGELKSTAIQFQVLGGDAMQAYKGNNLNTSNQDYIFLAPGPAAPASAQISWTADELPPPGGDPGKGALKILKYNKKTNTLVAGAIFEIKGVSESNWDFLVHIQASPGAPTSLPSGGTASTGVGFIELRDIRPGQYQITEITPPPNFDYCDLGVNSQVVTVVDGETEETGLFPQVRFENNPYASLKVKKINSVTGDPVNGAILRIKNALTDIDVEMVTANGGVIEMKNLPQGNYEISEVFTPNKYVKSDEVKVATLRWGETTEITFENTPKTDLLVKKIDADSGDTLDGAVFRLIKPDTGDSYDDTTYYDGYATFLDIPSGTYVLEEIKAPEGYILDSTKRTIVVESYKTNEIVIENYKKPSLIIKKYDEKTGLPLDGAEFSVAVKNGAIVYEGVAENGGKIVLDNLSSDWYTITEIASPKGYLIADKSRDVFLEPDTVLEVKIDNRPRPELLIIKTDDKGNPLARALFQIKKADGETIFERWTDDKGEILITFDDDEIFLEEGVYSVKEVIAPDGYYMDKDCHRDVTLEWGQRKTLTFTNTKKPTLTIFKIDEETAEPLAGAKFRIIHTESSTVKEEVTKSDGKILLTDLEPGIYSVDEIVAPLGYLLEPQHKEIELLPGDNKELVYTNKARPKLRIQKVDANTGELLKNAEFRVTKAPDKTLSEHILENGEITLKNLDEAIYRAEEFQPPEGYVCVQTPKEIHVEWGKTKTLKFDNVRKPVVMFKKTNALTGKGIPGAKYRIDYEMPNGGVKTIGSFTTDANGQIIIPKAEVGWYIFTETMAAPGFSLPQNPVSRQYFAAGDNAYLPQFSSYYTAGTGKYASGEAPNDGITEQGETPDSVAVPDSGEQTTGEPEAENGLVTAVPAGPALITPASVEANPGSDYYVENEGFNWPKNSIVIKKTDANTGELLEGAAFELYRTDEQVSGQPGTQIGRYVTDKSGIVVIVGLDPGYYVAKEVQPPANYLIAETSTQNGFLMPDGTSVVEMTFRNYPYGSILIKKVDAVNDTPLRNARFKVTTPDGTVVGNSNGEYVTDRNGEILIPNVPPGSYVITEIAAPTNYEKDSKPKTVKVGTDGATYSVVFENMPYGSLVIKKMDAETRAPLGKVEFLVTEVGGGVVGTSNGIFITDDNGTITIPNLPKGSYIVKEVKQAPGYILENVSKTITIDYGEVYTLDFYNQKTSSIIIKKVNASGGAPLIGAQFRVEKQNGQFVGEYTTDKDGTINVPLLDPDYYVVREQKAPDGFILDETPKVVEVKPFVPTVVTFTNKPLSGLKIIKLNSATRQPIEGVEFSVAKMSGEKVNNEFNGTTFKTDATGQIYIPNLTDGYYSVTETRSANGYILDAEPKNVLVESGKQSVLEVLNTPMSGLLIVKTDEKTGKPLQGVVFDVRRADGQFVTGAINDGNQPNTEANSPNKTTSPNGDITGSYTTDRNGRIQINTLPVGEYHVTERKALDGYELDKEVHSATVTPGKLTTLQITNKQKAGLRLFKIDSITKKGIFNVEFMVFDANNKVVGTFYTDNQGVIDFAGILTEGRYTIRETRAAKGYYLDEIPKTVEFVSGKVTEIRWENVPQMAQIQILKKSGDANEVNGLPEGTPLAGATFEAYEYKSGNLADRFVSGSDGRAVSAPLPLGRYIIKEVQAPQWYKLSDKTLDVELEFATQIVKLEYLNYAANTGVTIRKTGPNECMPGDTIRYDIKTVQNTGTTPLTDFFWRDTLSTDAVRLSKIVTGTYNQALKYKILATTNKGDTRVIADNLSTTQNNVIECANAALGLKNDEYITSFTLMFGTVKAGFAQVEQPQIFVKVLSSLPNQYQFANKADVAGKYGSEWVAGNATTLCTTYKKPVKLPRTGY